MVDEAALELSKQDYGSGILDPCYRPVANDFFILLIIISVLKTRKQRHGVIDRLARSPSRPTAESSIRGLAVVLAE